MNKIEILIQYHAEDYDKIKDARIIKIIGKKSHLGGCDIFHKNRYMFFIVDEAKYKIIEKKIEALDMKISVLDDLKET